MEYLTLNEQLEDLAINGYGIGWFPKHKMFWAFQFDQEDDREINWLDSSEWNCHADVCADDLFSNAVLRTHANMLVKVESSTFLGKACSAEYKKLKEERAKSSKRRAMLYSFSIFLQRSPLDRPRPQPDDSNFAERMKIEAKIETGSPEDRILAAIMEGLEASGKIMTPAKKENTTSCFMMGYTAGYSFAKIPNEETVAGLIQDVNRVVFGCMLKE